jgi:hypothetical protein
LRLQGDHLLSGDGGRRQPNALMSRRGRRGRFLGPTPATAVTLAPRSPPPCPRARARPAVGVKGRVREYPPGRVWGKSVGWEGVGRRRPARCRAKAPPAGRKPQAARRVCPAGPTSGITRQGATGRCPRSAPVAMPRAAAHGLRRHLPKPARDGAADRLGPWRRREPVPAEGGLSACRVCGEQGLGGRRRRVRGVKKS